MRNPHAGQSFTCSDEEIAEALKGCKAVAVMDRCESYNGHGGPLASEVMAALYENRVYTEAVHYVYGLAGRDFTVESAKEIFREIREVSENGNKVKQYRYVGLRTREGQ